MLEEVLKSTGATKETDVQLSLPQRQASVPVDTVQTSKAHQGSKYSIFPPSQQDPRPRLRLLIPEQIRIGSLIKQDPPVVLMPVSRSSSTSSLYEGLKRRVSQSSRDSVATLKSYGGSALAKLRERGDRKDGDEKGKQRGNLKDLRARQRGSLLVGPQRYAERVMLGEESPNDAKGRYDPGYLSPYDEEDYEGFDGGAPGYALERTPHIADVSPQRTSLDDKKGSINEYPPSPSSIYSRATYFCTEEPSLTQNPEEDPLVPAVPKLPHHYPKHPGSTSEEECRPSEISPANPCSPTSVYLDDPSPLIVNPNDSAAVPAVPKLPDRHHGPTVAEMLRPQKSTFPVDDYHSFDSSVQFSPVSPTLSSRRDLKDTAAESSVHAQTPELPPPGEYASMGTMNPFSEEDPCVEPMAFGDDLQNSVSRVEMYPRREDSLGGIPRAAMRSSGIFDSNPYGQMSPYSSSIDPSLTPKVSAFNFKPTEGSLPKRRPTVSIRANDPPPLPPALLKSPVQLNNPPKIPPVRPPPPQEHEICVHGGQYSLLPGARFGFKFSQPPVLQDWEMRTSLEDFSPPEGYSLPKHYTYTSQMPAPLGGSKDTHLGESTDAFLWESECDDEYDDDEFDVNGETQ